MQHPRSRSEKKAKPEPSMRRKAQLDRMAKVKKAKEQPRLRISPRDDEMRKLIKHPRAGAFRSSGSSEWPNDTFTQRRIAEGVVTLEASRDKHGEHHDKPAEEHSLRPAPTPAR